MTANGVVQTRKIGKDGRQVLQRSPEMEALIIRETRTLLDDWRTGTHRYDGLIYCMGWRRGDQFVPLYIGKAETLGKGKGNLSANIRGIETDRSKFAPWGDNYAYHVGDLSACVLGMMLPREPSSTSHGLKRYSRRCLAKRRPSSSLCTSGQGPGTTPGRASGKNWGRPDLPSWSTC